jgi:predicted DNA-binding ribbon-helix-helix protein
MDDNIYPDDNRPARPRRTRTPEEFRGMRLTFRLSRQEADDLYRYARARKCSMSYMIREALRERYPDMFANANRHIRKPRKPSAIEPPARIMHSLATGKISYLDPDK